MRNSYESEASFTEALKQDSIDVREALLVRKTWETVPSNHLERCQFCVFTDSAKLCTWVENPLTLKNPRKRQNERNSLCEVNPLTVSSSWWTLSWTSGWCKICRKMCISELDVVSIQAKNKSSNEFLIVARPILGSKGDLGSWHDSSSMSITSRKSRALLRSRVWWWASMIGSTTLCMPWLVLMARPYLATVRKIGSLTLKQHKNISIKTYVLFEAINGVLIQLRRFGLEKVVWKRMVKEIVRVQNPVFW